MVQQQFIIAEIQQSGEEKSNSNAEIDRGVFGIFGVDSPNEITEKQKKNL